MEFDGLFLVVLPKDGAQKTIELAFVDTRAHADSDIHRHIPTLQVDRTKAIPTNLEAVAVDDVHAYYVLPKSGVDIVPQDRGAADLTWSLTAEVKPLANDKCVAGKGWNDLGWILDFKKDLFPKATLDPHWRTSKALAARITLTKGELGTGDPL